MDENGIFEQSYYHWQRKFRKQAYDLIKENAAVPAVPEKTDITFVEVLYIQPEAKDALDQAYAVQYDPHIHANNNSIH